MKPEDFALELPQGSQEALELPQESQEVKEVTILVDDDDDEVPMTQADPHSPSAYNNWLDMQDSQPEAWQYQPEWEDLDPDSHDPPTGTRSDVGLGDAGLGGPVENTFPVPGAGGVEGVTTAAIVEDKDGDQKAGPVLLLIYQGFMGIS